MINLPTGGGCCGSLGDESTCQYSHEQQVNDRSDTFAPKDGDMKHNEEEIAPVVTDNDVIQADDIRGSDQRDSTPLFAAIENQKWDEVLDLLVSDRTDYVSFCGMGSSDTAPLTTEEEARTWIYTKNWWGKTILKSLPIHEAIIQKAPVRLIQMLLDKYPEGVRCADIDGNLPLHLAFKHGLPENLIVLLLKSFPEAVKVQNKLGDQPVDFANEDTSAIINLCVEQTNKAAKQEEKRLSVALESEKEKLAEILQELSDIRGELDDIKEAKQAEKAEMEAKAKAKSNAELLARAAAEDMVANGTEKIEQKGFARQKKTQKTRRFRLPWTKKKTAVAPQM